MAVPLAQNTPNSPHVSHRPQIERSYCQDLAPIDSGLPDNFAEVVKGVYRSSFPLAENLETLKELGLRTILTLVDEPYTTSHLKFLNDNGISHLRIIIPPNKDPEVEVSNTDLDRILGILLNKANHPVLVHCNKGKHRTGCVVACFRRLQGWALQDVIDEYLKYSTPKSRTLDVRFIGLFDSSRLSQLAQHSGVASWASSTMHLKTQSEHNEREQIPPNRRIYASRSEVRASEVRAS
ncbi:tyrosine phosphatase family protein [Aspergillus candidus]|uniref:diphosphoinositol-polyphosphate diphosphatase n=1 Tax=Aspergillus candidus TaxID=41067 RepID=A0A2I2FE75_ASPCN|nr:tyrosine phosphatase family-domain-containing protein [Aspergillus candidus]PLB38941.1 tyrosine phosphatase family-domain-containing protein [Aspergillus candidus]